MYLHILQTIAITKQNHGAWSYPGSGDLDKFEISGRSVQSGTYSNREGRERFVGARYVQVSRQFELPKFRDIFSLEIPSCLLLCSYLAGT